MNYTDGEIVNRLRHFGRLFGYDVKPLFEDAASEIEILRKEHETMRRTLEIISADVGDQLQATQARGALANIGPAVTRPD